MALGSWGDLPFEVRADKVQTWRGAKRDGEARWGKLDVFNAKPVREFLGPDNDRLTLSIDLDATHGVDVDAVLSYLREARDSGRVETLFFGEDVVFDCTVNGLSEDQKRFNQKGQLLFCTVDVTFEEYV